MTKSKGLILIVEDNLTNMKLVRDVLHSQNYETIEAYTGKEALKKASEYDDKIDLILMDIQIPEFNGIEVAKILKSDKNLSLIPIFAVSAHVMENDIQKALEAGIDEYIIKPINIANFINKINLFFENRL